MKKAKSTGEPYAVKEIQQADIYDFDDLSFMFNWPAVKVASVKQIMFKPNDPKFYIKYEHADTKYLKKIFFKKGCNLKNLQSLKFQQLYRKIFLCLKRRSKT